MDTGQILAEIICGGELRVHLIGVAGSGMSGIAGLLLSLGHTVSGSDRVTTIEVERLQKLGLDFFSPQNPDAVQNVDLVIFSSAIRPGNCEYDEAARLGVSMVRRADALAALLNCKKGIVIAGMHGKTTTSSMAAHVLRECGLRPSHYVGAEIPILGTNANWDPEGEHFVAEGDESDGTIANYHPEHAIVLNIELEHLDYYDGIADIDAVYGQLAANTHGKLFYCADDEGARRVCASHPNAVSFGESADADYRFANLSMHDFESQFDVLRGAEKLFTATLNVPGRHNVSNAMGVIALALELGVAPEKLSAPLAGFRGARRRFEIKHRSGKCLVVDDYAHHPSEIRTTLATAKAVGRKRILVMFQPHRYSRTKALRKEFGRSFQDADVVFVTDIYPASELPLEGVTGQSIVDAIAAAGHADARFEPVRTNLTIEAGRMIEPGDFVVSLGAGDIHEQTTALAADLGLLEKVEAVMGPGVAKLYEPLAKHTTLRVGGPAQVWAEPDTEAGFAQLVRFCSSENIPLTVLGRGSNLLVRDGGIRGVVAPLVRGEFKRLDTNHIHVTAGAGVRLKELCNAAKAAGIGGLEWMEGIPGNVGGALRMNAGAMGGETFRHVVNVTYVDGGGEFHTVTPEELEVHYRGVPALKRNYAVRAVFQGRRGDPEESRRLLQESLHKRRETQPAAASAGCIFKNPPSCPAGRLVDELGLKNTAVGKARVSEVHGNFIVNDGGATAAEVLALIDRIKETAMRERGIALETEVEILGEERGLHEPAH